jgi:hypothetical protein
MMRPPEFGSLVYVRYRDHVLFKDMNPGTAAPFTRECVGWFDYEDQDYIRILWERFAMPDPPNDSKPRATGLVILKEAILEMHRIG